MKKSERRRREEMDRRGELDESELGLARSLPRSISSIRRSFGMVPRSAPMVSESEAWSKNQCVAIHYIHPPCILLLELVSQ